MVFMLTRLLFCSCGCVMTVDLCKAAAMEHAEPLNITWWQDYTALHRIIQVCR